MTGLVYTAITGDYDMPLWPVEEEGVDYILFSDRTHDTKVWSQARVPPEDDPRVAARKVKVLIPTLKAYRKYSWFLWIDGNVQIVKPIRELAERMLSNHDFAAFKHPWWQCSYTEVDKCIAKKKDDKESLEVARELLTKSCFPKDYGQLASGILLRKQSDIVKEHAELWWGDMESTTMRDQATFMLNLWCVADQFGIEWIPGSHLQNPWFKHHAGHNK